MSPPRAETRRSTLCARARERFAQEARNRRGRNRRRARRRVPADSPKSNSMKTLEPKATRSVIARHCSIVKDRGSGYAAARIHTGSPTGISTSEDRFPTVVSTRSSEHNAIISSCESPIMCILVSDNTTRCGWRDTPPEELPPFRALPC